MFCDTPIAPGKPLGIAPEGVSFPGALPTFMKEYTREQKKAFDDELAEASSTDTCISYPCERYTAAKMYDEKHRGGRELRAVYDGNTFVAQWFDVNDISRRGEKFCSCVFFQSGISIERALLKVSIISSLHCQ